MNSYINNPKFKVGETVILQSTTHPQFNGLYIVEDILDPEDYIYICRVTGEAALRPLGQYGYRLDTPFIPQESTVETIVEEFELKKHYPPAGYSFEEMINKLKKQEAA